MSIDKLYKSRYDKQQQISGLNYSNRLAAGYYGDKITQINKDIKRVQMDNWYENIANDPTDVIDLHGVHRQFINEYILDILDYKFHVQKSLELTLITGRGTGILHKYVKNNLVTSGYKYKVIDNAQFKVYK